MLLDKRNQVYTIWKDQVYSINWLQILVLMKNREVAVGAHTMAVCFVSIL